MQTFCDFVDVAHRKVVDDSYCPKRDIPKNIYKPFVDFLGL
jgi:hypothetical protein